MPSSSFSPSPSLAAPFVPSLALAPPSFAVGPPPFAVSFALNCSSSPPPFALSFSFVRSLATQFFFSKTYSSTNKREFRNWENYEIMDRLLA